MNLSLADLTRVGWGGSIACEAAAQPVRAGKKGAMG